MSLNRQTIREISIGDYFVIALTNDSKVYSWGRNNKGQLGRGNETDYELDAALITAFTSVQRPLKISSGQEHTLCLVEVTRKDGQKVSIFTLFILFEI